MQLYDVVAHTERGTDLPQVVNENLQTGKWGTPLEYLTNSWASHFPTKMTKEAINCLCNLSKVETRATQQRASKIRLRNWLISSGHCKNTKRHALECDCYRKELLRVSDEVTWAMRQHGLGFFTIGLPWGQD